MSDVGFNFAHDLNTWCHIWVPGWLKKLLFLLMSLLTHFRGLRLKSSWGMLTLIRVGSFKLLHVIIQNNLNTCARVECFCCSQLIRLHRSASAVTWASAPGIKQLWALYVPNSNPAVLNPRDLCASSSFLCLSGSCDSLQQDGEDCCFLLHLVPALFGVPGTSVSRGAPASVSSWFKDLTGSLRSSFRCYTRPRGARVLAETAPLSVLKSEIVCLQSLSWSFWQTLHVSHSSIVCVFSTGMLTISTSSMRMTQTSKLFSPLRYEEAGLAVCMSCKKTKNKTVYPTVLFVAVTITPTGGRFIPWNHCQIDLR